MARKYILENNELRFGHVDFHKQLASDKSKVVGGGYWYYDASVDVMFLYGSSEDFGSLTNEQVQSADRSRLRRDSTLIWTGERTEAQAMAFIEKWKKELIAEIEYDLSDEENQDNTSYLNQLKDQLDKLT